MSDEADKLYRDAMRLSPKERAELAAKLVSSINAITEAEQAWNSLIVERARRVLSQELGSTAYLRKPLVGPEVRFELDAEVVLERAATRYSGQPGTMQAFLAHIQEALEQVRTNPAAYGFHAGVPENMGVRRVHLREFPYTLAFVRIRGHEIRILSVAHNYRSPAEGDISIDALISVEEWLTTTGVRALTALSGVALSAVVSH